MSKATDEMRVPLNDILGIPGFLNSAAKESWLKENNVEVIEDWNGRESVDLPTAWRLKRQWDIAYKRIREEAAVNAAREAAITQAQRDREELYGKSFSRQPHGIDHHDALRNARLEVLATETQLPRDVRERLTWPLLPRIIFPETVRK